MQYFAMLVALLEDACAFIFDPEARQVSEFTHSSGQPMSVREARELGLLSG